MAKTNPDKLWFLAGGGEAGALMRAHDWSDTPIGAPERWPETVRVSVSLMLGSGFPMYIAWGPNHTLLYNDAYAAILRAKHPAAMGQPFQEVWPEVWAEIEPVFASALAGATNVRRNLPRTLRRNGADEQTYFTFSTSPLRDGDHIIGVFCACQETTVEVRSKQMDGLESERMRELFRQAPGFMAVVRGPNHTFDMFNDAFLKLVGDRPIKGLAAREALPEVVGQGILELLDKVYATGEAFKGWHLPVRLQRVANAAPETIVADFVYQPIHDADGRVSGIFVEGVDVTLTAAMDEKVRESERFARATIDALAKHIAVIEQDGTIVAVNRAWREFAEANVSDPTAVSEGANYLGNCDRQAARGDRDAGIVAGLIRDVASGERARAEWEYDCHLPSEERWFSIKVTRFSDAGPIRIVLDRENITHRRKSEQRIEYLATHDALTGLPNRNLLEDRAQQSVDHARRTGLGLALLFLDLDNFKYLNDAYGHSVGDNILEAFARELRTMVRAGDTVARIGGDEFVILLTDLQDTSVDAANLARTMLERFSRPLPLADRETTVTPSIGISVFPADGETLNDLLRNADAAMYRAKKSGRAGFQFYSADMSAKANERVILEGELRRAIRLGQFELHFQPQVRIDTGESVGMEALLRWPHPELGLVPPDRFIPVAEESGLIVMIGRCALKAACAQIRIWQRRGLRPLPVAVNISAAQLKHPDFVDMVGDVLEETGLDPRWLELEITESMVMEQSDSLVARLTELKAFGIGLSIDDFGTGYSNLGYLKSFPLDRLKIDRSFVSGLPDDPNAVSIVRAILAMSRGLGLEVIAEGVETAAQADLLAEMGCKLAQGFYYCLPLAADEMEARLQVNASRVA